MANIVSVSNFVKRSAAPEGDNPYYLKQPHGYNKALLINDRTHSVLPNCCGWVHGRWLEIAGWQKGDSYPGLCTGNAGSYYRHRDNFERSQTPRVGDIGCWENGGDGHVAIVEAVSADGTVTFSNSAYGGKVYYSRRLKAPYSYTGSYGKMNFQGFIRCPYVTDDSYQNVPITKEAILLALARKGLEIIIYLIQNSRGRSRDE